MAGKPGLPVIERILSKIRKDEVTGCWIFTGAKITSRGGKDKESRKAGQYGYIGVGYKNVLVHRYMYWYYVLKSQGIVLNRSMCVCHKCDNTVCCNPEHLFLGTHRDNSRDASNKGRLQKGERHTGSTLTEKQVLEIFTMKGTLKEIGAIYSIAPRTVLSIKKGETWKWLTKNSIPVLEHNSIKLTNELVLEIFSMKGTHGKIGKIFNISSSTVSSIKSGITWSWLTKGRIPVKENSILTKSQVIEIFSMKGTYNEIGKLFNIGSEQVRRIKCGKCWSTLTKGLI